MRRDLYEPDHDAYRETVREFLAREVVPYQHDWDRDRWIDRSVFAHAAKTGIYALQIDERFGGAGENDYRPVPARKHLSAHAPSARSISPPNAASQPTLLKVSEGLQLLYPATVGEGPIPARPT